MINLECPQQAHYQDSSYREHNAPAAEKKTGIVARALTVVTPSDAAWQPARSAPLEFLGRLRCILKNHSQSWLLRSQPHDVSQPSMLRHVLRRSVESRLLRSRLL
jgi:hypothetical protein